MRKLGDKIGSKLIAEEVGVPVAPWSRGGVDTLEEALAAADRIGYPLMLKATAGGGGRGIRMVASAADLEDAYQRTRDEAERAFGSGVVFLERLVTGARHVEVQVIADGQGTAWALGVRDCSVQRRNQKVIEESASPLLDREPGRRAQGVGRAARPRRRLRRRRHRRVPLPPGREDLRLPRGQHPAPGRAPDHRGDHRHRPGQGADPRRRRRPPRGRQARPSSATPSRPGSTPRTRTATSRPSPGRIALLELPSGPGIRVDTGVGEGDTIPADFDSMIAKIIAFGRTRDEALARLRRAMAETTVVIEGGATNKSFVLDLLDQPEVIDGTGRLGRHRLDRPGPRRGPAGLAPALRGRAGRRRDRGLRGRGARSRSTRLLETARGGRPQAQHEVGRAVDLKLRGTSYKVTVLQIGPHRFRVTIAAGDDRAGGRRRASTALDEFHSPLTVGGQRFRLVTATHGPVQLVEVDGVTHRVSRDEGGVLRSPAPALVVATPVAVGDEVAAGAPVLVLESHEDGDRAARAVRRPGAGAAGDRPAARSRPARRWCGSSRWPRPATAPRPTPRVRPGPRPAGAGTDGSAAERAARGLAALSAILLGFDIDADTEAATLAGYLAARDEARTGGHAVVGREIDAARGVRRPRRAEPQPARRRGAAHRAPGAQPARALPHLPAEPRRRRGRAARAVPRPAGRGARALRRRPSSTARPSWRRRSSASSWPSSARRPTCTLVTAPAAALDRRAGRRRRRSTWPVREVLDRLVRATQLRFPVVGDLARSVRFRWFDQPLVDAERSERPGRRARRARRPRRRRRGADRADRIDALAAIPEQIVRFLAERLEQGVPEREPMLEVLIRRHYREYDLHDLRALDVDGRPFAVADYSLDEPADPPGLHARHGRRAGRPGRPAGHGARRRRSPPAPRRRTRPSSTSTSPGPASSGLRDETPGRADRAGRRAAVRRRRTPRRGRRLPRRRPPGRLLHLPPGDRRRRTRWPRTTWSAACTRWSAAG